MANQTMELRRPTAIYPQWLKKLATVFSGAREELTSYFLIMGRSVLSGISEESIKRFGIDCAKFNGR